MRRRWRLATHAALHRVMMMQARGRLCRLWRTGRVNTIHPSALCGCNYGICPGCVFGVVQQSTNVVNKQRIEQVSDLLLVGKVECSLERNPFPKLDDISLYFMSKINSPDSLKMHWANLDNMSGLFRLENAISTPAGHPCNIQQLRSVDEVVIYAFISQYSLWFQTMHLPSRRATQTPLASTWKQRLPSSSHSVAVTRGFMPGGAI